MNEKILEVKNITQCFGGLTAVCEVSMEVYKNQIVGLIGPNGAGKTTVFNVITGLYTPTSGKIIFKGKDITGEPVHKITRCGIARTFQNIRLFNSLSVLDNVRIAMHSRVDSNILNAVFCLPRNTRSEKKITEECMELLHLMSLASKADDPAGSLPYGSQRRLEIIRAMATGARMLMLDEPAAGMNEKETAELMELIHKVRDMDYTILLIEHDMKVVMNVCENIYVQNYGKLIANGTPMEIQNNSLVIEAYLGKEVLEDADLGDCGSCG
ncbi:MAG: ABC transporter ATP-binding protein [Acetivibrionales bacterium]|jgi:branched-chain amino acid transport system ATP-binding protein